MLAFSADDTLNAVSSAQNENCRRRVVNREDVYVTVKLWNQWFREIPTKFV